MKKIIGLIFCLSVGHCIAMDSQDYTVVDLDRNQQVVCIESVEGLRLLAQELHDKSGSAMRVDYTVEPQALAQYFFFDGKENVDPTALNMCRDIQAVEPDKYQELVISVLYEMNQVPQHSNLLFLSKQFRHNLASKHAVVNSEIKQLQPAYNNKWYKYVKMCALNGFIGIGIVSELAVLGLLSWVIDHCHHPWG